MSHTLPGEYPLSRKITIFIWAIVSNAVAFFLGMVYLEKQVETRPREWINISVKKSTVNIEQSSDFIDIWINGEKRKMGESYTLEEKK